MKLVYQYTQDIRSQDNGPFAIPANDSQKNAVFQFTLGDTPWTIEPGSTASPYEVPSKVLRIPSFVGSGAVIPAVVSGDRGPHEDFLFMQDSVEYTYTTRQLVSGGVIEKQMPVGAKPGQEGRMVLYKGCTTLADAIAGVWTERLIRPFLITAADITNRQTGWPASGSAPSVNTTNKFVVDNNGDGYNHI